VTETPDRQALLRIFLAEAFEAVAGLEESLGAAGDGEGPSTDSLLVVVHRLKGSAAVYGFPGLAGLAGMAEAVLDRAQGALTDTGGSDRALLGDLVRALRRLCDSIADTGEEDPQEVAALCARLLDVPSGPETPSKPPPPSIRAEVNAYFAAEATEHLESITTCLLTLEQEGPSEAALSALLRAAHTLKGAAYTVGHTAAAERAHQIEEALVGVREERIALTPAVIDAAFAHIVALRRLVATDEAALTPAGREPAPSPPRVVDGAGAPRGGLPRPAPAAGFDRLPPVSRPFVRVALTRLDALASLVGELVIARNRLETHVRGLERIHGQLASSRSSMTVLVKDLDRTRLPGRSPIAPAGPGDGPPVEAATLAGLFADLDLDRGDDVAFLSRRLNEISADVAEVQSELGAAIRTLTGDAAATQQLMSKLRGEVTRTRMVPVGAVFARLRPPLSETARAVGKAVLLATGGDSVELDGAIVEQIADPLLHLVQNAVVHGIESADERRARGKPPDGCVKLSAYPRGGSVCIEVADDGRGIDVAQLRERAVRGGFLPAAVARRLSDAEALDLIFLPGLSTAALVTAAAGRGIGLDVVRTNVARLNGKVTVTTEAGVGTRFTLTVPLTVLTSEALMVRVGRETLALPLRAVQKVVTAGPEAIEWRDGAERLRVDDQLVPVVRLDRVLGLSAAALAGRIPVVLLRTDGGGAAAVVDEIVGKQEHVVKSLGPFLEGLGPFAGAIVSAEGRVIFVLDPSRLTAAAEPSLPVRLPEPDDAPAEVAMPPAATEPSHVLLVDDSVSVRKFVGHMLEKGGLRVVTASDGAEALERLAETAFQVVITDLEMPRVNGFELIQDLRRRPATRDVPVVVLTTRAGAKHLDLARWLGVDHYLAKPVEEEAFVRLITSLAGTAADGPAGEA
jgi:chemosensory pili system protein ChpA (sensor histidine kinase/response regulator)